MEGGKSSLRSEGRDIQTSNDDEYHLTINDVIALPGGEIADYRPTVVDNLNIETRSCSPREESELRLEDLKGENNILQASPDHKPVVADEQAATLHPTIILEVGNSSNIQADSRSNSTSNTFANNEAQNLPARMAYHVFISHAREDRDWVIDIINKLEAPPHSLKCCFADRDFELGRSVFENITRCVQSSMKTVIVLSPEFLDSSWCDYEIRITMEMDLTTRRKVLIPLMLRPCRIPDFLGRLTYIGVDNEHFWDRFVYALQNDYTDSATSCEQDLSNIFRSNALRQLPYYHNMDEITEVSIYKACYFGVDLHSNNIPHRLTIQTPITIDDYNHILDIFKHNCYASCHGCFSKLLLGGFLSPFVIMGMFFLILILYYRINSTSIMLMSFGLGLGACFLTALLIVLIRNGIGCHAARSFTKSCIQANEIAHRHNLLIGYKDYGCCGCQCDSFSIVFYYYNWRLCESHLRETLNDHTDSDQVMIHVDGLSDHEGPEEQILSAEVDTSVCSENQTLALDLLMRHVPEYVDLFAKTNLFVPVDQRHTRQGECLCQFVENVTGASAAQHQCFVRIFGLKSRFPITRLFQFLF